MKAGVLYVGTDDGLVHISKDAGRTWTEIGNKIPDLPKNTWCSRVLASKWAEGRVYATFDGHRSNDFKAYAYVSEDYGQTWTKLSGGLPDYDSIYVIREGERNPDLLYLGSEMSLRISLDRGKQWSRFRNGFPTVAVHDANVHPRELDLVVATHGRAIWTVNVSALEQLTAENQALDAFLAKPQNVLNLGFNSGSGWDGDAVYLAPNSQPGTTIFYHLKSEIKGDVTVTVSDVTGTQKIDLKGTGKPGLNSVVWNGRIAGRLTNGDYRVTLKAGGKEYVTSVRVEPADGVGS
jgi:hypothetical protein